MFSLIRLAATLLLACALLPAVRAADAFSWRRAEDGSLLVALANHPYSGAVIRKIPEFERLTGIRVAYAVFPESGYHDILETRLAGSRVRPDVFMVDVHQTWSFAGRGRLADLDRFLADPALTRSGYNPADFFTSVLDLFRWTGRSGDPVGLGPLWAAPLGFGTAVLVYDRALFSRLRLRPPATLNDLLRLAAMLEGQDGGGGGVLIRDGDGGDFVRSVYFSLYSAFGARDLVREGGRLAARVNSPEAAAATGYWLDLMRHSARMKPADGGGFRPALALDWDALGYFAAAGAVPGLESRFGFAPPPPAPGASSPFPALLAWGLAVNSQSERQEEAWLFAQYFTDQEFQSFLAIEGGGANPPRRSVFESREFQERIQSFEGYAGALADALNRGRVPLTPTRQVFRLAGHWASVIRDIESGLYPSVQAGLDNLNRWLDARLAEAKERESP